jgi:uncharacterized protein
MDEQIKRLAHLQATLSEAARIQQQLQKLPAELAQAEATQRTAQKKTDAATASLEKEEKQRADLEQKITALRDKATRFRVQLDVVKTPEQAAAVENEIEFATSEADRLETEEFASLERSETEEATRHAAQEELDEASANLATIREGVASREAEYREGIKAQQAEAEALRPTIDEDLLAEFDRIARARAGVGIARADNQQCTGCRMGIRLQVWMHLCEGERAHCDSCGRMLYYQPASAAIAAEDRPTLAPGQGRAPRRPRTA